MVQSPMSVIRIGISSEDLGTGTCWRSCCGERGSRREKSTFRAPQQSQSGARVGSLWEEALLPLSAPPWSPFPAVFFHFSKRQPIWSWKLPAWKFSQGEVASKSRQPHPDRPVGESSFPWDSGNLLWIQRKSLRKSRLTIKTAGPAWIYHRRGKTLSPRWWIRGLFPHHRDSEVPPRAVPQRWNDPLSAGPQAGWETATARRTRGLLSFLLWSHSHQLLPREGMETTLMGLWHDTNSPSLPSLAPPSFAAGGTHLLVMPCWSGGAVNISNKGDLKTKKESGATQRKYCS